MFNLIQHVKKPTHEHGHILDLIVTRKSDDLIDGTPFPDKFISDHSSVLCRLKTARPSLVTKNVTFRKYKSIDISAFMDDISNSNLYRKTHGNIDELVASFNNTFRSTLDHHAPVKSKNITIRPRVPWMKEEIRGSQETRTEGSGDHPNYHVISLPSRLRGTLLHS